MWLDAVTYLHHHGYDKKVPWYRGAVSRTSNNHVYLQMAQLKFVLTSGGSIVAGMELHAWWTLNDRQRLRLDQQHSSRHRNTRSTPSVPPNSSLPFDRSDRSSEASVGRILQGPEEVRTDAATSRGAAAQEFQGRSLRLRHRRHRSLSDRPQLLDSKPCCRHSVTYFLNGLSLSR